ncbi:response regulator transcription factor [uncultured Gemmiger sp.]|uniref:response regulator transcription factor n=1 Tax=uncultured Gemmiger sp. TaxID=1623490 RepID=UPI0025E9A616|nr:response regulator transcription factor [uncultured Gemmiger sp.]
MQYRIFLIEDDPVIARTVRDYLTRLGYTAAVGENFADLAPEFSAFAPQLVLLDLSLPYHSGYHWCRVFREMSQVPIVFLSSAGDSLNIVTAMELGADDYIAKPFDLEVLGAKVQAILRRTYAYARPADLLDCGGGVVLDLSAGALRTPAGAVELTKNELRILQTLLSRRGRTVPREDLMTALWATDCFVDENTLTVNVARLRKKLEAAGLPGLIHTRKGEGYLIP